MKVVLFCGGLGTRLREHSDTIPKPLVNIGVRPIIWHLMRYYAHYGHKDFVLCLGYRGDLIKEFFLNYNECLSNDFVFENGGRSVRPLRSDIEDWRITFADTGMHANIGERLWAVRPYLEKESEFLANYSDGLTDLPLDEYLSNCRKQDCVGNFVASRTAQSFHAVHTAESGIVTSLGRVSDTEFWINAGFFLFKTKIFDYMQPGEELVEQPFQRLIDDKQLYAYKYQGFWQPMDTFKEKIAFDRMYARNHAPWQVWRDPK